MTKHGGRSWLRIVFSRLVAMLNPLDILVELVVRSESVTLLITLVVG